MTMTIVPLRGLTRSALEGASTLSATDGCISITLWENPRPPIARDLLGLPPAIAVKVSELNAFHVERIRARVVEFDQSAGLLDLPAWVTAPEFGPEGRGTAGGMARPRA